MSTDNPNNYGSFSYDTPPHLPPMGQIPPQPRRSVLGPSILGCSLGCGGLLIAFFLIGMLFAGVGAITQAIEKSNEVTRVYVAGESSAAKRIAILQIHETLEDTDGFINDQIEDILLDDTVQAVILRMDTPGGTVSASDFFYNKLTKLREKRNIPILVSMGGVCASGGYYISMAVGKEAENVIFAEPTTWTGSIGVILSHYNLSKLAEKIGLEESAIRSHELKGMGGLFRPLTDQERTILQELVDDAFQRFQEVVHSGRKKFHDNPAALSELATGQVFTTSQALENGLIDKQGYLEDVIDRALEMTGLTREDAEIYTYEATPTLASLLSSTSEKMDENAVTTLQDALSPRACYLWTVGQ